ncbi:MAG: hypothetical protein JOY82_17470 [Streptosporangiaceae bacterium]|nr:hypothetical protein [Streptosporangiaceae bacterium]MBV9856283.1 hypothetical protein [Streptosporangiaceae bacterium]
MWRDTPDGSGWLGPVLAVGLLCLVAGAGCSSGPATASGGAASGGGASGTSCGSTRTGANVPVLIRVAKGTVSCGTAMRIENEYAAMIRTGAVKGNGGGAPVRVSGWTCQGYPTPQVLSTGDTSECHTATDEVLAVLAVPSSAATPGGG